LKEILRNITDNLLYSICVGSLKNFHKNLLMTKSNDRMLDFVKRHASRPH